MTLQERLEEQIYLIDKLRFPSVHMDFDCIVYKVLTHQFILAELMLEVVQRTEKAADDLRQSR